MTTPNFTQDVPQWIESASWQCITALLMLKNQSLTDDDVRGLHAAFHGFIAKHAPQPEAKEVAALESMLANEEQACMEALEERDTAIGFCDLFAATILGEDINWSCHETKWQEALDMMSNGKTIEVSGIMLRRSGDHAIVEAEVDGKWKEVIREYIDAPFSHIVEPAGIADAKESELNSVPDGVEATPTTAATDAASGVERFIVNNNSVRYACTKLAAVGDKVKVIGSNPPLHMNVEEISPTGGLYIKSPTGAWCMLLNSSQVEFVPEVTPAQPVEPQQASAERWRHFPLNMKSCADGEFVTAADHDAAIAELRAEVERVKQWELDAWRTVGNLEDAAEGRPIEIEDGKSPHPTVNVIAELREKLADEERRGDLHADLNKRVAEAIGNPFTGPGSSWHDLPEKVAALRTRAEAAEAEVARLHKIIGDCEMVAFDNSKPPQLWSWIGDWEGGAAEPLQRIKNAKDAVKEIASLTAQLAAANERVAEFEARLDAVRKMISAGQ